MADLWRWIRRYGLAVVLAGALALVIVRGFTMNNDWAPTGMEVRKVNRAGYVANWWCVAQLREGEGRTADGRYRFRPVGGGETVVLERYELVEDSGRC